MFSINNFFFIILLHLIIATPQINLYFTKQQNPNENIIQENCIRTTASINQSTINHQIISYCITESLTKYNIKKTTNQFPNWTFAQLAKQNITSQQLYQWSTSIDLIEDYQEYLLTNDSSMETNIFYNCTLPRFGSICQYEFNYYQSNYSSLYNIISDYYHSFIYKPINVTCYMQLECNRGVAPLCLDWSEICDGKFDCLNDGIDEKYCWVLEVNECNENEYRCADGQCIPKSFYLDDQYTPDCLDQSDEHPIAGESYRNCILGEPSFACEDVTCKESLLTSSCSGQRLRSFIRGLFAVKDPSMDEICWSAFKCSLIPLLALDLMWNDISGDESCLAVVEKTCPDILFTPVLPVLFNEIYFAYTKSDMKHVYHEEIWYPYKCYNNTLYDEFFSRGLKMTFNNLTCYRLERLPTFIRKPALWMDDYIRPTYTQLKKYNLIMNYSSFICNRSNMYQCMDSVKCISIYRLLDGVEDCPHSDDEDMNQIHDIRLIEHIKQKSFNCQYLNKSIPQSLIQDKTCDCGYVDNSWCEDETPDWNYIRQNISFQTICDGLTELHPKTIDGQNYTDETECELWVCNNIYTHCDGFWQCPNGEDETDCYSLPSVNCSLDQHICVLRHTNQLTCLSLEKANDGHTDCLGGTDELDRYYDNKLMARTAKFKCMFKDDIYNPSVSYLCDGRNHCLYGDDEQFCNKNRTNYPNDGICLLDNPLLRSDIENYLCHSAELILKRPIVYFSLDASQNTIERSIPPTEDIDIPAEFNKIPQLSSYCHRGIDLQLWLDKDNNSKTTLCLCPPSYYGNQCQYQNQRISLVLQFQAPSNSWQIPFAIITSLIDNEGIIHSYEQFTYLSVRDCHLKFNVYLLYATRSKNQTKSYSINIDIYEKDSLAYRGSLLFPIKFTFLPVHRLAFIINIPPDNNTIDACITNQCHHGICIRYSNQPENETFCQCDRGWSGKYCNIPYTCQCSSHSKCLGITNNNRSICVCLLDRFGPRCYIINNVCSINQSSPCLNNGQCIPNDEYIESDQKYRCICRKGFIGKHCEIVENKIILSFNQDIIVSQLIFIHFIQFIKNNPLQRTTTLKTLSIYQNSLIINWSQTFHMIFIEFLHNNYYLAFVEKNPNNSISINTTITTANRCLNISEIFNETIVNLHPVRRIKYYQLPCQRKDLNLSCFYDDVHLCLCQLHQKSRLTNCLEFHHNMTFDCLGQSVCENGGQCFQDKANCPERSICICPTCYYGNRCQFSSSGFRISLDAILGYHIQPNIRLTKQSTIIQISTILTCLFLIVGLINSILALITFNNKSICDVGCGIYLLCASIITLLTTCMFGLKFWILLCAQMGMISNRIFLSVQCHLIDFILRIGLNMDQWLNACVAMERTYTAIKGTRFNKTKSKQIAKFVIISLFIIIIGTNIQDPIYRQLIDEDNDDDEKRIWCIVSYSSGLQTFNYIINIFHFILPFLCNLISAIILIIRKSHQKSDVQTHQNYHQHLREQIHEHKHLLITPIVLVILALPHLILSFASKCMKSSNDSWLYIVGYFISFISPMLTFIVFVLPSTFYKQEFQKTIRRYRTNIQQCLQSTSLT